MKKPLSINLILIISIAAIITSYFIQTLGTFDLKYNSQLDKTPGNGKIEVQKVSYQPPIGNKINNGNINSTINLRKTLKIPMHSKVEFYNKAFIQIIDKTLIVILSVCFILFLIRRNQLKKAN